MTTFAALIPRLRYRTSRVIAIRCTACKTWRKPRHFNPRTNTCHGCAHEAAHRRITTRATRRG